MNFLACLGGKSQFIASLKQDAYSVGVLDNSDDDDDGEDGIGDDGGGDVDGCGEDDVMRRRL